MSNPILFSRIDEDITTLTLESLEDSLKKLSSVNMFFWPGPSAPKARVIMDELIPLPKNPPAEDNVMVICSNRRFMKLLDELGQLPKDKAAELINNEIESTTAEYLSLYNDLIESVRNSYDDPKGNDLSGISGVPMYIEDPNDGQTVILGARYKLLSLVLIAGNLNLENCRSQIIAVSKEAFEQRDRLYASENLPEIIIVELLTRASLYDRQILATGLLSTNLSGDQMDKVVKDSGLKWLDIKLTKYNAAISPFDFYVRNNVMKPDFSEGFQESRYLSPMNDEVFNLIMESASD